jgi:hypothetical protein
MDFSGFSTINSSWNPYTSNFATLWSAYLWNSWIDIPLSLCVTPISSRKPRSHGTQAEYIVVITGRELQGHLMGHDVFRATEFDIIPLNTNVSVQNPSHPVEAHLLALLRSHLYGGFFLFSYTYDLTRRMQTQWETRAADADKAYWEVVSKRVLI